MLKFANIIEYVFILGAGQGILLSIFLFRKKENIIANRILAFTMIAFSFDLFVGAGIVGEYYKKFPHLIGANAVFPYLYGPSIYLYTLILGHKREDFKRKYLLHYLPFILINIYGIFFFYFEDPAFKISIVQNSGLEPWHIQAVGNLIPFHGCTYVVLTLFEARKFNAKLKESYSNIDQINLSWLTFIIVGTTIIWIIVVLSYILNFIYGEDLQANLFIYIGLTFLIYSMGYKSLRQPEIRLIIDESIPEEEATNNGNSKQASYKKSGLNEDTAKDYLKKLLELMSEKKPFTDSKINLADLSSMLGISTHNLSEVINTQLNQNFYDFINKYRIDEVKKLIEEDKNANYSILALGYDAGFSSKSAFYTAFKKHCNITPAQYREGIRK